MNTDEKTDIVYRKWQGDATRVVFLLVHGLGGYSLRWNFLAQFFLKHDVSSYAIDLKGFGKTETLKGHVDSFRQYYHDIRTLRSIIEREHNGKKVFLIGESMGGLIAFVLAALAPRLFDGLICISPAFKSRLKFSLSEHAKILFSLIFCPKKQFVMPFDAPMCTSDENCQKMMDEDKQEHKLATPKLLFNIFLTQMRARVYEPEIKIPVLFLMSDKDDITDSGTAEKIFKRLRAPEKQIARYARMRHALSIEKEREKVFEDILRWVEERIGRQNV